MEDNEDKETSTDEVESTREYKQNRDGGGVFHTRSSWSWGPPILIYNGYRVCFPGVKRPGRGVNHPPPSSAEVKERVELYLYSPSGPSWPALGLTLPFYLYQNLHSTLYSVKCGLIWTQESTQCRIYLWEGRDTECVFPLSHYFGRIRSAAASPARNKGAPHQTEFLESFD